MVKAWLWMAPSVSDAVRMAHPTGYRGRGLSVRTAHPTMMRGWKVGCAVRTEWPNCRYFLRFSPGCRSLNNRLCRRGSYAVYCAPQGPYCVEYVLYSFNNSNKYQMLNEIRETKGPAAEVLVFD